MADNDVTSKSGVYEYLLSGEERKLSLRQFSDEDRRIINSLADFIGGLSETAGKVPEESQVDNAEPSSSPAIPVQE